MKLKVLLAPLLIVAIVVISIWLVYPAYTNGVDGFKEKRDKLAKDKSQLENINTKENNISSLYSKMDADKDSQKVVFTYIPQTIKEEEIIDNLNYLSSSDGLSVAGISITNESPSSHTPTLTNAEGVPADVNSGTPAGDGASFQAVDNKVQVKLTVIGPYSQIKDLIGKIYSMERFNKVDEIDIKSAGNTNGVEGRENQSAQLSDSLQADITLTFNYFKGSFKLISIDNPNLSKNSFDMKTIADIKDRKNVEILQLNIDQAGRPNPFMP